MKYHLPEVAGKILSVLCAGEDTGQLIHDPSFEEQGGRLFLIGTVPKEASRDNWMEGLPCAIAWDTVQDYVTFASMDDYLTRLRAPRKRWPASAKAARRTKSRRTQRA